MTKPRYRCTHCGRNEIDARAEGCGKPDPTGVRTACPMDLASRIDRFLFNRFGVLPK